MDVARLLLERGANIEATNVVSVCVYVFIYIYMYVCACIDSLCFDLLWFYDSLDALLFFMLRVKQTCVVY